MLSCSFGAGMLVISQEGLKRALPLPALPRVFSLGLGWKLERGMQAGAVSVSPE